MAAHKREGEDVSRHSSSSAYGFKTWQIGHDHWRMSWTVDFHYASSRLRFPRGFTRDTDFAGAQRFAKRHGLRAPEGNS
jgi:hypothetical protein